MSGIKFMGKDNLGNARAIKTDIDGNLGVKITGSNTVISKHLANPVTNKFYGENIGTTIDTVKPSNYSGHRGRSFYIVNNTNVAIALIRVYGHIGKEAGSPNILIGTSETILSGASKLLTAESPGLEKINDDVYDGISIGVFYAEAGTGTADVYLLGEVQKPLPKTLDVQDMSRKNEVVMDKVGQKTSTELTVEAPPWAKGAMVALNVKKLNGLDPSIRMYTTSRIQGDINLDVVRLTDVNSLKTTGRSVHMWNPNASLGDAEFLGNVVSTSFSPQPTLHLSIVIEGVGEGTGIDYTCRLIWIK